MAQHNCRIMFGNSRYRLFSFPFLSVFTCLMQFQVNSQSISDTSLFNKPHFIIETKFATYLYDKSGGGFSSIYDKDGVDWIQYSLKGDDQYPESAAGRFRGLPNFVFRSEDSGAGHPGFEKCISEKVGTNEIVTKSKSGKWMWRWKFFQTHATVTMEKADLDHAYWFLYEGIPGGSYAPKITYWGTDVLATRFDAPDFQAQKQVYGNWRWAYFGSQASGRVFYVGMTEPDEHLDTFSFLAAESGNLYAEEGMVVFGFGRNEKGKSLMGICPNTFFIGFYEKPVMDPKASKKIARYLKKKMGE